MRALEAAIGWLQDELRLAYPRSATKERRLVAAGVWSMALVADEGIPLQAMRRPTLRAAAERLVSSLGPGR
jgi:hypothetical protein